MEKCRNLPWGDKAIGEFTEAAIKQPELASIYNNAIEAVRVLEIIKVRNPYLGCVHSSIAFTHGLRAVELVRIPVTATLTMIDLAAQQIAKANDQQLDRRPNHEPFSLTSLDEYLKKFPIAWANIKTNRLDLPFVGHQIGIIRVNNTRLTFWNTWEEETLAVKNKHAIFSYSDVSHLYSVIRHLHTCTTEKPILFGFR